MYIQIGYTGIVGIAHLITDHTFTFWTLNKKCSKINLRMYIKIIHYICSYFTRPYLTQYDYTVHDTEQLLHDYTLQFGGFLIF